MSTPSLADSTKKHDDDSQKNVMNHQIGNDKSKEENNDRLRQKAMEAYYAEVAWLGSTIAFLVAWLHAVYMNETTNSRVVGFFDREFLQNGFCNSHDWPTQKSCGIFDFTMAALLLVVGNNISRIMSSSMHIANKNATSYIGICAYLVAHGSGHWKVYLSDGIDMDDEIHSLSSIFILALILAMGAYGVYMAMIESRRYNQTTCVIVAMITEFVMVFLFVNYLRKDIYGLTYINIAINLCGYSSKLFFTSPDDLDVYRRYYGSYHYSKIVTALLVNAIIWLEPTCCTMFMAKIGGHFWFDVALFLAMFVEYLKDVTNETDVVKAKKEL